MRKCISSVIKNRDFIRPGSSPGGMNISCGRDRILQETLHVYSQ